MKKQKIYHNFYEKIYEPLYKNKEKEKLFNAIQLIFNPEKFEEIKKAYEINSVNIESILYGYRYCLNELDNENEDGIYSSLYNINNINYLSEKYYPGSDTKNEPYYELFYKIQNHFIKYPNEGGYVCLCNEGYYHSVPSGFPGELEKNLKCPKCSKEIGTKEIGEELDKKLEIVNRDK